MGLTLYDLLSYDRNRGLPSDMKMPASRFLNPKKAHEKASFLKTKGLKGGFLYYDYQSLHPERLTLAFLKSAVESGCLAYNHMSVVDFVTSSLNQGHALTAVKVKDEFTSEIFEVKGKQFINATGPWTDLLLKDRAPDKAKILRSQGLHLLTNARTQQTAVLHRNPQGRHFFLIPWMGLTLSGPTDTPYKGNPDDLKPVRMDADVLRNDINEALDQKDITDRDVKLVPIGLRPLIFSGKSTYHASRKSEIFDHAPELTGLLSVAGGKWTTSRALGETVASMLFKGKYDSSRIPLYGAPGFGVSPTEYEVRAIKEFLHEANPIQQALLTEDILKHLIRSYGTEHKIILKMVEEKPYLGERLSSDPHAPDIKAQVIFAVQNEGAQTLEDVVERRLLCGTTSRPDRSVLERCAELMKPILNWDDRRMSEEIQTCEKPVAW
jgi:glycerol-3-phosphate dehydrogenase